MAGPSFRRDPPHRGFHIEKERNIPPLDSLFSTEPHNKSENSTEMCFFVILKFLSFFMLSLEK